MTYRELAKIIIENPEQWNKTVTIFDDDKEEYCSITGYTFIFSDDVLDNNHLIICF